MKNLIEWKRELEKEVNYIEEITNYSGGTYVDDAFREIADNNTSIYYSDITKYLCNNIQDVENTISEYGWDGVGKDLYKAAQIAQYNEILEGLYNNIQEISLYYIIDYIITEYSKIEIDDNLENEIYEICAETSSRYFSTLEDRVKELFENSED